jgi:hypothetical protein
VAAPAPKPKEQKPAPAEAPAVRPKEQTPAAAKMPASKPKLAKPAGANASTTEEAPVSQLTRETIFMRELAALPERHKEAAAKRKAELQRAHKPEAPQPSATRRENLAGAAERYLQLKEWVRANDATELEWYEAGAKEAWQHAAITKDNFLRLYYRTVWMTGSQPRVVAAKEDDYFRILTEILYVKGQFQPRRQSEFLMKVAAVLGGSADNKKNKAIVQVVELIETTDWDEFRKEYASPQRGLAARLQSLPLIGPKQARLLLQQLGIADPDQDNTQVARFASQFGYADAATCLKEIAARTGDAPATIDFVIWDSSSADGAAGKS